MHDDKLVIIKKKKVERKETLKDSRKTKMEKGADRKGEVNKGLTVRKEKRGEVKPRPIGQGQTRAGTMNPTDWRRASENRQRGG